MTEMRMPDLTLEGNETKRIFADRERWVARGVTRSTIAVARAEGARIETVDGRSLIDFVGGIGCQNLGHSVPSILRAVHEQVDAHLHQFFIIGAHESYVQVCRRLAELSPCEGTNQKSALFNSGAEAVENAVKIARVATGRPAVLTFERGFHGRTLLALTMTGKVGAYKSGFGPYAPEIYQAPAPYEYRGFGSEDALRAIRQRFVTQVDPRSIACMVVEPIQGEGGFIPMPAEFLKGLKRLCEETGILLVDDEVQAGIGRTGRVWGIEHSGVQPDLLVSGGSLGGGLPLSAVTGRSELMDSVTGGGLGGTFGGNPASCAAAEVVLDSVADRATMAWANETGRIMWKHAAAWSERFDLIGDVRGLGPMLGIELVGDRHTKAPNPTATAEVISRSRESGLLVDYCGLERSVIRLIPPITIDESELAAGLEILGHVLEEVDEIRKGGS